MTAGVSIVVAAGLGRDGRAGISSVFDRSRAVVVLRGISSKLLCSTGTVVA